MQAWRVTRAVVIGEEVLVSGITGIDYQSMQISSSVAGLLDARMKIEIEITSQTWCSNGCSVDKLAVVMRLNCSMLSVGNSD